MRPGQDISATAVREERGGDKGRIGQGTEEPERNQDFWVGAMENGLEARFVAAP